MYRYFVALPSVVRPSISAVPLCGRPNRAGTVCAEPTSPTEQIFWRPFAPHPLPQSGPTLFFFCFLGSLALLLGHPLPVACTSDAASRSRGQATFYRYGPRPLLVLSHLLPAPLPSLKTIRRWETSSVHFSSLLFPLQTLLLHTLHSSFPSYPNFKLVQSAVLSCLASSSSRRARDAISSISNPSATNSFVDDFL